MNKNTLIGILIVLLILVGVYAIWEGTLKQQTPIVSDQTTNTQQPQLSVPESNSTQTQNTNAQQPSNNSAGVSFTNTNDGYSFQYPSEWNAAINHYNKDNVLFGPNATSTSAPGGVEVHKNQASLQAYLSQTQSDTGIPFTNETNVTVNGVPGIQATTTGPTGAENVFIVVLFKNNTIYSIYYQGTTSQDLQLFNQFVQSFTINN